MRLSTLCAALFLSGTALAIRGTGEIVKDLSSFPPFNLLDVGVSHVFAAMNASSAELGGMADMAADGKLCDKGRPCSDGSCCNSNGYCGYRDEYCKPKAPATCLSNCKAKAPCGSNSYDGKQRCELDQCCSWYGYCGSVPEYCNAHSKDQPCQAAYGSCEVKSAPKCGRDSGTAAKGRHVAYYAAWNTRKRQCNRIWPSHIRTGGLTHLNFAFASIDPKTFQMVPMEQQDVQLYKQFTALKSSKLETWIAVGGWDFSDNGTATHQTWSQMASTKENRGAFILSAIAFMERYGFQGIDLDWEYPVAEERGGMYSDKANYVSLVKELREAFKDRYGLSVAIPATFAYLRYFDPKAMEKHVSWFNLMSYDLHGKWDALPNGIGPYMYPHTSLKDLEKGLRPLWFTSIDPKKINMGTATYGRGYTVKDKGNATMGAPFLDWNRAGPCTDVNGVMSNREIRRIIREKGLKPEYSTEHSAMVIKWDDQWMSYDDKGTLAQKVAFANDHCFGGIMVWTADFDSGAGTGNTPNHDRDPTGENNEGKEFYSDVFPHQDIWVREEPVVECVPPCTLILPPLRLPSKTTISWPPLVTTLLTITGGQTGTTTTTVESLAGGTITKVTSVILTVKGGSSGTITTTLSIPPFVTDVINFWPVSVEPTDEPGYVFEPLPSITPPSFMLTLGPGTRTFPPTRYPGGLATPGATVTSSSSTDVGGLWFYWGTGSRPWTIQPMPTIPVPLPTSPKPKPPPGCTSIGPLSQLRDECKVHIWPSRVTFHPFPPKETCTSRCGTKNCQVFGCGCGPLQELVGPGCNTGCKGTDCGGNTEDKQDNKSPSDSDDSDSSDTNDDRDEDDTETDGDDDDDDEKPKPTNTPKPGGGGGKGGGGGGCGKFGCGNGCGTFGCGGDCGLVGCGGRCINGNCAPCPLNKCGGLGCRQGACNPPPGYPHGGNPDKPKCEEENKNIVTDYWVSCTKYDQTSSSCTTPWSVVHSGCGISATTTTTKKGPACTKAQIGLDDDQGDDEGDPIRPTRTSGEPFTPPPTPKPTPKPTPTYGTRTCDNNQCGCCLDYYYWCKGQTDACKKDIGGVDCIEGCIDKMCYDNEGPQDCKSGARCGNQMGYCRPHDEKPHKRNVRDARELDAALSRAGMGGPLPTGLAQ